jgi:phage baseplate assembly protein V
MARKNILSDTDYTKGTDNRFKNSVLIAKVSKLEVSEKGANIRAILPDKVDHQGQPLITKPIPVLQVCAGKKRSFAMPRVGQNVVMIKLPNGAMGDYLATGFFYTSKDPPPVTDPMLDYCVYDDGSTKQFDASSGTETNKFKGDTIWDHEGEFVVKLGKGMTITPQGDVLIDAPNIELKGQLKFTGDITHTGNMTTSGTHTDSLGHHTNAARQQDLERRIEALEARVAQLEAVISKSI